MLKYKKQVFICLYNHIENKTVFLQNNHKKN
jgi:hypothetical protein